MGFCLIGNEFMDKLMKGITIVFFLFIAWIIFSADTGRSNVFFEIVNEIPYGDKFGHFFLFGLLTFLLNVALRFKRWKKLPLGTALVSVFVTLEELSQMFFSNRTMDWADLMADGFGIFFFTYIGFLFSKSRIINV